MTMNLDDEQGFREALQDERDEPECMTETRVFPAEDNGFSRLSRKGVDNALVHILGVSIDLAFSKQDAQALPNRMRPFAKDPELARRASAKACAVRRALQARAGRP